MWPGGWGHKPERTIWMELPLGGAIMFRHFRSFRFQKFNPAWSGGSRSMGKHLTPATFTIYQYVSHKAHLFKSYMGDSAPTSFC